MQTGPLGKMTKIVLAGIGLLAVGAILFSGGSNLLDSQVPLGIQPVSANTQYGILGRQAPEIDLDTWIDGNGKPMDPLRLEDYRGMVIYLYFFQDW
jgi:hypothetical protein